jgi:hypothetical protein
MNRYDTAPWQARGLCAVRACVYDKQRLRYERYQIVGLDQIKPKLLGNKVAHSLGIGKADHRLVIAITIGDPPELADAIVLPDAELGP